MPPPFALVGPPIPAPRLTLAALSLRTVHLDFRTGPNIPCVRSRFRPCRRPKLFVVDVVLEVVVNTIPIERAMVMGPPEPANLPAHQGHPRLLGLNRPWQELGRHEFYASAPTPAVAVAVAVVVATGAVRHYANLLLPIVGVRPDRPTTQSG